MREFQAVLASSAGLNRDRHRQLVEEKNRNDKHSNITSYSEKRFIILSAIAVSAVVGCLLIVLIFWLASAHQLLALNQRRIERWPFCRSLPQCICIQIYMTCEGYEDFAWRSELTTRRDQSMNKGTYSAAFWSPSGGEHLWYTDNGSTRDALFLQ